MQVVLLVLSEFPFLNCAKSLILLTGLALFIKWWRSRHSWKVLVEPFEVAVPNQPSEVGSAIALKAVENLYARIQHFQEGHSLFSLRLGPQEDMIVSMAEAAGHGLIQSIFRLLDGLFPPHGVVLRGLLTSRMDGISAQAGATLQVFDMRDRQIQALRTIWRDLAGSQGLTYSWYALVDQIVDWFIYTGLWVQYGNRGTSSYRAFYSYFQGLGIAHRFGGNELEKELAEYERSVAADESFSLGQLQLATTLHRLGKHEGARTRYEQSLGRPIWLRAIRGPWEAVRPLAEFSLNDAEYGKAAWLFHWAKKATRSARLDNPDDVAAALSIYRALALSMTWHRGLGIWGNRKIRKLEANLTSPGWESLYCLAFWYHQQEDRQKAAGLLARLRSDAPSDMWLSISEQPTWQFPEYEDVLREHPDDIEDAK